MQSTSKTGDSSPFATDLKKTLDNFASTIIQSFDETCEESSESDCESFEALRSKIFMFHLNFCNKHSEECSQNMMPFFTKLALKELKELNDQLKQVSNDSDNLKTQNLQIDSNGILHNTELKINFELPNEVVSEFSIGFDSIKHLFANSSKEKKTKILVLLKNEHSIAQKLSSDLQIKVEMIAFEAVHSLLTDLNGFLLKKPFMNPYEFEEKVLLFYCFSNFFNPQFRFSTQQSTELIDVFEKIGSFLFSALEKIEDMNQAEFSSLSYNIIDLLFASSQNLHTHLPLFGKGMNELMKKVVREKFEKARVIYKTFLLNEDPNLKAFESQTNPYFSIFFIPRVNLETLNSKFIFEESLKFLKAAYSMARVKNPSKKQKDFASKVIVSLSKLFLNSSAGEKVEFTEKLVVLFTEVIKNKMDDRLNSVQELLKNDDSNLDKHNTETIEFVNYCLSVEFILKEQSEQAFLPNLMKLIAFVNSVYTKEMKKRRSNFETKKQHLISNILNVEKSRLNRLKFSTHPDLEIALDQIATSKIQVIFDSSVEFVKERIKERKLLASDFLGRVCEKLFIGKAMESELISVNSQQTFIQFWEKWFSFLRESYLDDLIVSKEDKTIRNLLVRIVQSEIQSLKFYMETYPNSKTNKYVAECLKREAGLLLKYVEEIVTSHQVSKTTYVDKTSFLREFFRVTKEQFSDLLNSKELKNEFLIVLTFLKSNKEKFKDDKVKVENGISFYDFLVENELNFLLDFFPEFSVDILKEIGQSIFTIYEKKEIFPINHMLKLLNEEHVGPIQSRKWFTNILEVVNYSEDKPFEELSSQKWTQFIKNSIKAYQQTIDANNSDRSKVNQRLKSILRQPIELFYAKGFALSKAAAKILPISVDRILINQKQQILKLAEVQNFNSEAFFSNNDFFELAISAIANFNVLLKPILSKIVLSKWETMIEDIYLIADKVGTAEIAKFKTFLLEIYFGQIKKIELSFKIKFEPTYQFSRVVEKEMAVSWIREKNWITDQLKSGSFDYDAHKVKRYAITDELETLIKKLGIKEDRCVLERFQRRFEFVDDLFSTFHLIFPDKSPLVHNMLLELMEFEESETNTNDFNWVQDKNESLRKSIEMKAVKLFNPLIIEFITFLKTKNPQNKDLRTVLLFCVKHLVMLRLIHIDISSESYSDSFQTLFSKIKKAYFNIASDNVQTIRQQIEEFLFDLVKENDKFELGLPKELSTLIREVILLKCKTALLNIENYARNRINAAQFSLEEYSDFKTKETKELMVLLKKQKLSEPLYDPFFENYISFLKNKLKENEFVRSKTSAEQRQFIWSILMMELKDESIVSSSMMNKILANFSEIAQREALKIFKSSQKIIDDMIKEGLFDIETFKNKQGRISDVVSFLAITKQKHFAHFMDPIVNDFIRFLGEIYSNANTLNSKNSKSIEAFIMKIFVEHLHMLSTHSAEKLTFLIKSLLINFEKEKLPSQKSNKLKFEQLHASFPIFAKEVGIETACAAADALSYFESNSQVSLNLVSKKTIESLSLIPNYPYELLQLNAFSMILFGSTFMDLGTDYRKFLLQMIVEYFERNGKRRENSSDFVVEFDKFIDLKYQLEDPTVVSMYIILKLHNFWSSKEWPFKTTITIGKISPKNADIMLSELRKTESLWLLWFIAELLLKKDKVKIDKGVELKQLLVSFSNVEIDFNDINLIPNDLRILLRREMA